MLKCVVKFLREDIFMQMPVTPSMSKLSPAAPTQQRLAKRLQGFSPILYALSMETRTLPIDQDLGPDILLILITGSHGLDDLLALLLTNTSLLRDDGGKDVIDLTRHVCRVAADVEVGLLLEELVDLVRPLLQPVLHVDLLWPFP